MVHERSARLGWSLGALFLCACMSAPDLPRMAPGEELAGRSMTVETANGQTSDLAFSETGAVEARFGGRRTQGRWAIDDGRLCFTWAQNFRECWPYERPFLVGQSVRLRSDRGNDVLVTLH